MKTTIQKDVFFQALSIASRFTSSRIAGGSNVQGVLLEQKEGILHLYSTNLNSFFHTQIPVKGGSNHKCMVDHQKLLEFLSYIEEGEISYLIEEGRLLIVKEKTKGVFPLFVQGEIPLPPSSFSKEEEISPEEIFQVLSSVLFSASKDMSRPVLGGVHFVEKDDGCVEVVTTDGFRLSLMKVRKKIGIKKALIPADFLFEILRYAKGKKSIFISEAITEKIMKMRVGDDEFFTRLIEGEYPPYERVLPVEKRATAIVGREDMIRNIKLIAVFAREFSSIVLCSFSKGTLSISPKAEAGKENVTQQEIQYEGEDIKTAFNYKFLLEYLNGRQEDEIQIEMLRADAPVVFKTQKQKEYVHIIMPVRIQE